MPRLAISPTVSRERTDVGAVEEAGAQTIRLAPRSARDRPRHPEGERPPVRPVGLPGAEDGQGGDGMRLPEARRAGRPNRSNTMGGPRAPSPFARAIIGWPVRATETNTATEARVIVRLSCSGAAILPSFPRESGRWTQVGAGWLLDRRDAGGLDRHQAVAAPLALGQRSLDLDPAVRLERLGSRTAGSDHQKG